MDIKTIATQKAPAAIGPYAQGVIAGNIAFLSGQLGLDPATGALAEGVEAQTHQAMKNIGAMLESQGASYGNIVKTTIFVQDLGDFGKVNEIYAS